MFVVWISKKNCINYFWEANKSYSGLRELPAYPRVWKQGKESLPATQPKLFQQQKYFITMRGFAARSHELSPHRNNFLTDQKYFCPNYFLLAVTPLLFQTLLARVCWAKAGSCPEKLKCRLHRMSVQDWSVWPTLTLSIPWSRLQMEQSFSARCAPESSIWNVLYWDMWDTNTRVDLCLTLANNVVKCSRELITWRFTWRKYTTSILLVNNNNNNNSNSNNNQNLPLKLNLVNCNLWMLISSLIFCSKFATKTKRSECSNKFQMLKTSCKTAQMKMISWFCRNFV